MAIQIRFDDRDNIDSQKLLSLMNAYGLSQAVREPTNRSGHTLDHVYFNEYQFEIKHEVVATSLGLTTDHFPIILEIPGAAAKDNSQTISYRKLKFKNILTTECIKNRDFFALGKK